MEAFFQQLLSEQFWLKAWLFADSVAFGFYFVAIFYLFIFAIGSVIRRNNVYKVAKKRLKYATVFMVGNPNSSIVESVNRFFEQDYPTSEYDVIVVSHDSCRGVNAQLSDMPVRLMVCDCENYTETVSIQYVMANLAEKAYDVVVVMDADSVVEPDFLTCINNAYYSGVKALQTHRMARSFESDTAIFSAASEEINNSIFRKGHTNFGLSSALAGSGMAFDFTWFKSHVGSINTSDFVKPLETMLLDESIFIDYLSDVHVYGKNVHNAEEFTKQRRAWMADQQDNIMMMVRHFPSALVKGNYDYCDKLFQWLMPSRTILMGTLFLITFVLLVVSWALALKWLALLLLLIVGFSVALPDYLIDARFVKVIRGAPLLFILTIFNGFDRFFVRHKKAV